MKTLIVIGASLFLASPATAQRPTPLGRVRGRVMDVIDRKVLGGALVQLTQPGTDKVFSAETDSLGEFRIDSIPEGKYVAGFFHPALEDLGVQTPLRPVDVGFGETTLLLTTPPADQVLKATCAPNLVPDSTGLLVGRVVDAETEAPLAGATVRLSWYEVVINKGPHEERRLATAKTDAQGMYGLCGIPTDGSFSLVASIDSLSSGTLEVQAPAQRVLRERLAISRQNVRAALPDSLIAHRADDGILLSGTARIRGTVRTTDSRPLAGASVTMRGTNAATTTDARGAFTLGGLPGGTQALEVRAIGYTPNVTAVNLRNGDETTAEIAMDTRIPTLDAVHVFGKAEKSGFDERRQRSIGRFVTPADIARKMPFDLVDIFRNMPGFRVLLSPTGHVLRYRNAATFAGGEGCAPTIYLNGLRTLSDEDIDFLADPRAIAGIEVYAPHEQPAQFFSDCVSVVIWVGMTPK